MEKGLGLEELAEQTGLSRSALGNYEKDDTNELSIYALKKLADFYGVTTDYLLARSEMKKHPNAELDELRLSDEMIDLLTSGRINNAILCELALHKDFGKLLADMEIYVNGIAAMQIQNLNVWVDMARSEPMDKYNPGESDSTAYLLNAAHIHEGEYFSHRVYEDGLLWRTSKKPTGAAARAQMKAPLPTSSNGIWRKLRTSQGQPLGAACVPVLQADEDTL